MLKRILIPILISLLVFQAFKLVFSDCSPACPDRSVCNNATSTCACNPPFTGSNCTVRDPCKILDDEGKWITRDCSNRGQCVPTPGGNNLTSQCNCTFGYVYSNCERRNACAINEGGTAYSSPLCQNGGTCHPFWESFTSGLFQARYSCKCNGTKVGMHCEFDDPCSSRDADKTHCNGHGTCISPRSPPSTGPPLPTCRCWTGYSGDSCEIINPCLLPKNAKHCLGYGEGYGGLCNRVDNTRMSCTCNKYYMEGERCEIVNLCKLVDDEECNKFNRHARYSFCMPCLNDGKCTRKNPGEVGKGTYSCNCNGTGYVGEHCETLMGNIIIIPQDTPDNPSAHVATFQAKAGREYVFFIVAIEPGEDSELKVDTGDGLKFDVGLSSFKFVQYDHPVLSGVYEISNNSLYYVLPHIYLSGTYNMSVQLINEGDVADEKSTIITSVFPPETNCTPTTKLRYASSDPTSPTEYLRTDKFVVEAILKFECLQNQTLSQDQNNSLEEFHYEWRLHQISPTFPAPNSENDWHVELLTNSTGKHVVFKPHVLLPGSYIIECRAYVTIDGINYGHSELGYFDIKLNPPRIKLLGSFEQSVDTEKEIVLDASASVDDSFPEDSPFLIYKWTCDFPCNLGPWEGPVVKIPPNSLTADFKVHLVLASIHSRTIAVANITLHVANKASLSVECVRNCEKFNPGDEVAFNCSYIKNGEAGSPEEITWSWNPTHEVIPELEHQTTSSATVILPEVRDVGLRSISCNVGTMTALFQFVINTPPTGGNCNVTPAVGVYLTTPFTLSCLPFVDQHQPLRYSFYVEVHGDPLLMQTLGNRLLLAHDTNPVQKEVYLPLGNATNAHAVNITVRIMDSLGLYTTVRVTNVKVTPPPAADYSKLFQRLIYGNDSLLKVRHDSGDEQGALQLQMIASYGVHYPEVKNNLRPDEKENLLSAVEHDLLFTNLPSFKKVEQVLESIYLLEHVEERMDVEVLTNISRVLFHGVAKLAEYSQSKSEITPKAELDILSRATVESASHILEGCYSAGFTPLALQPEYMLSVNQRDVTHFDRDDTSNRGYFFDVHDSGDNFEQEGFSGVADSAGEDVKKYAKVCHHAILAIEHILDGAVGYLGYVKVFEVATALTSVHAEILPNTEDSMNLTMNTVAHASENMKVQVVFPNGTISAIQAQYDANHTDMEIQVILTDINPFFDDTSADPHTPILNIMLKDSKTHTPILIEKIPTPIEVTFPFVRGLSEAELDEGKTNLTKILVLPPDKIDDYTEFVTFKLNVPYNSIIHYKVQDPSSPTMQFVMTAVKDRQPRLTDFCNSSINASENGMQGQFVTEPMELNETTREPFLEYHVGFLGIDLMNPDTVQEFSVVFARSSCLYRDEDQKFWSEEGCMVEPETVVYHGGGYRSTMPQPKELTCLCNHLSFFSAVQFIIPATVNNDTESLADDVELDVIYTNFVVLITVSVILLLYLICLGVCWCFDLRDQDRDVILTLIEDIRYGEQMQFYMITVITGCNFYAGTSSSVGMVIYGSKGRSKPIIMKDRTNDVFRRGGVDTFLICDKDLGQLEKIRIWTDYSGANPDWYCWRIMIRHISSETLWYFFVNRWFTVTAEESTVILEISSTTKPVPRTFCRRYKDNIMEHFNNVNLWFSIFRYSPVESFTRCQRLSCAFGVLTSYLFVNIIFHGMPTKDEGGLFKFGQFSVDLFAMVKAIYVVLMALPFGVILVGLFRYIVSKNAPTVLFWEKVIPAEAKLSRRNFYVPKMLDDDGGNPQLSQPKHVRLPEDDLIQDVFTFETPFSDEEEDDDSDDELAPGAGTGTDPTGPGAGSTIQTLQTLQSLPAPPPPPDYDSVSKATTDSRFSIPSTDIPALEDKIADSAKREEDDDKEDSDDGGDDEGEDKMDEYKLDKYIYALESKDDLLDDSKEANNLFRLGRRALIETVRDEDPHTFVFQGEHGIPSIEKLIDEQLLEGAKKKKESKKKKKDKQEKRKKEMEAMAAVIQTEIKPEPESEPEPEPQPMPEPEVPPPPPQEEKPKKKKKKIKEKKPKEKPLPWKKRVTEEYLKDIDMKLEQELENRRFIQDEGNWKARTALEMCMLPRFIKPKCSFPWWFIFIAWIVCLTSIVTTSIFTVIFGISYGYLQSLQWLDTYIESFFLSAIVVQPLSGCLVTFFGTIVGIDAKAKERVQVQVRNSTSDKFTQGRPPFRYHVLKAIKNWGPPTGSEVFRLSIEAKRRNELRRRLVRLILCVFLIVPLIIISHCGHSQHNYGITRNIRHLLQLNPLGGAKTQFKSEEMVFKYLENVVIPNIHPTELYNGQDIPQGTSELIADQQSILVGVGRVRQQRVKPEQCSKESERTVDVLKVRCSRSKPYSKADQDRATYNPQWEPVKGTRNPTSETNDGWEFHGGESKKPLSRTYSGYLGRYDGGGYILELGRTKRESESVLKYMKRTNWLDEKTRAIFVEFTLLNPNVNKFIDVVLLIEQTPTWSFSLISWITPMELIPIEDLKQSDEITWISVNIAVIILIWLILVGLLVHDLTYKPFKRLLSSTPFWFEFTIILLVFTSLVLYSVRFVFAKEFANLIDSQTVDEYLSIQKAAFWTDIQRTAFSVTQAVVFIRIMQLLMFTDHRFLTFALTLKLANKYLEGFTLVLLISICGFAMSGYFIFGQELWEFSTWNEGIISLIGQILGVRLFRHVGYTNRIIGLSYWIAFGLFIAFIGIKFIIALLDVSVHEAKEVVQQRKVWLTYSQYLLSNVKRVCAMCGSSQTNITKQTLATTTLRPGTLYGMKVATAAFLQDFLRRSKYYKMKEMEAHCNKALAGTGYRMISKKQRELNKEKAKQSHIEKIRKITTLFMRDKLGFDMKPEEFKEYAKLNKIIVHLRIKQFERKVEELERAMDIFLRRNYNYVESSVNLTKDMSKKSSVEPETEDEDENKDE